MEQKLNGAHGSGFFRILPPVTGLSLPCLRNHEQHFYGRAFHSQEPGDLQFFGDDLFVDSNLNKDFVRVFSLVFRKDVKVFYAFPGSGDNLLDKSLKIIGHAFSPQPGHKIIFHCLHQCLGERFFFCPGQISFVDSARTYGEDFIPRIF